MASDIEIDRQLYSGLLRLHVLYHAAQEPIFGFSMIEELSRHGYKVSPGVMYPLLRSMEHKGYLCSTRERSGRSARRLFRATPLGRNALSAAMVKVQELFSELFEHETVAGRARRPRAKMGRTNPLRGHSRGSPVGRRARKP